MLALLADANIEGHLEAIVRVCTSDDWAVLWEAANVRILYFNDLRLAANVGDSDLWRICQKQEIVLLTGNRNHESEDSLEAVIRAENSLLALPVLTIADPDRVFRDRRYLERVAGRLIDVMLDVDLLRGAGRLYLP